MHVALVPVENEEQIAKLAQLAGEIWREYWPDRIGTGQTEYMVQKFQSLDAIKHDMAQNAYEYWFICDEDGNILGYTGGHEEPETNRFFISKVYLLADERGKGYASQTIAFYRNLCESRGLSAMYLTVNKHNDLGIRAYKGKGFEVIDSVETDIGEGYIMDDYIMELRVGQ